MSRRLIFQALGTSVRPFCRKVVCAVQSSAQRRKVHKKRCLEAWWPKWIALRADTRTHHQRYVCRTCHFSRLELRPVPLEPFANGLHCAPTRTHRQHCTYPPCQLAVRGIGYICIDDGLHCATTHTEQKACNAFERSNSFGDQAAPSSFTQHDLWPSTRKPPSALATNGCRPTRSRSPGSGKGSSQCRIGFQRF